MIVWSGGERFAYLSDEIVAAQWRSYATEKRSKCAKCITLGGGGGGGGLGALPQENVEF